MNLREYALALLLEKEIDAKVEKTVAAFKRAGADWSIKSDALLICDAVLPGLPSKPELVAENALIRRSLFTPEGAAALIHSIAHIEFSAINLALDAIWRFPHMPRQYYLDWLRIAGEEAMHFSLLRSHLQSLGYDYGDFSAHQGLWEMCEKTRESVLARMALVPRTMEARGLDATPLIQAKLRKQGGSDALRAVAILDLILAEEIGHVAIGNYWYRWLCEQERVDPVAHYGLLVQKYSAPRLKPPFNLVARSKAGFSDLELKWLEEG